MSMIVTPCDVSWNDCCPQCPIRMVLITEMRATDNNHCEFRIDNFLIYNYYFWHSSYGLILWKIWIDCEHWTLNIEHYLGISIEKYLSKNGNTLLINCTRFKTHRKSFQYTFHKVAAIYSTSISFKDFKWSSELCRSIEVGMLSSNRKRNMFLCHSYEISLKSWF